MACHLKGQHWRFNTLIYFVPDRVTVTTAYVENIKHNRKSVAPSYIKERSMEIDLYMIRKVLNWTRLDWEWKLDGRHSKRNEKYQQIYERVKMSVSESYNRKK